MDANESRGNPRNIIRHINKLFLDPNNYRFVDQKNNHQVPEEKITDLQVQKRTEALLLGKNNENVRDLISSFKENGFLPLDQIQVKELAGGNYLVLEGNRRVATLKYLYKEWRDNGLDIGKLDESDFKSVPVVLHSGYNIKEHLVVMGLNHITGKKKWSAVSQAQYNEDLIRKHNLSEEEVCNILGITKHSLRRSRRTLGLIKRYKVSDYGDQFENSMYSIFEEIIRRQDMKHWLDWDDESICPKNLKNEERLFSWLSKEEEVISSEKDGTPNDKKISDPIITKSEEIRELAKFITDESALSHLEEKRSITQAYVLSDALGETKFGNALDLVREYIGIVFNFSQYMKEQDTKEIIELKDKLDRLIPSGFELNNVKDTAKPAFPGITRHYSEIFIRQFRGLHDVILKNVNKINILAGPNNSGKTSILEATYLLTHLNDIDAFFEMEMYRGKFLRELNSKWLEKNFLDNLKVEGQFDNGLAKIEIKSLNTNEDFDKSGYLVTFSIDSQFRGEGYGAQAHIFENRSPVTYYQKKYVLCPSIMTSPYRVNDRELRIAHGRAVENKGIDRIIRFIRDRIDHSIERIDLSNINGVSRFFVTSSKLSKSIDITNYGEGVQRVFEIALFFAYASNGILLIDEFESAIHKSLLIDFSRFVQELAEEFNVQVFLTSHSKECIDAFIRNNYKTKDITAYSLTEDIGGIQCKYIEGSRLEKLLDSIDVDIRGDR